MHKGHHSISESTSQMSIKAFDLR